MAVMAMGTGAASHAAATQEIHFGKQAASVEAREMAHWVASTGDAAGKPFVIVDKKAARLHLFDAAHHLVGSSVVLVGQTVGDATVPGVGERAQTGEVGADERTTPAGRFESEPGKNLHGETVVWLDYQAAFAIHRLRRDRSLGERLARLRSPSPADNRASLGCVVVPEHFYVKKLLPLLGHARGVAYVLPELPSSAPLPDLQQARNTDRQPSDSGT